MFKERGIAEFTGPGRHIRSISNACDISLGEPVVPLTWHTDRVEVYNDVGRFQIRALLSSAVRPGEAIIYHAWDNFQFSGWQHFKNVMPSPVNPLEFAGGYFQLRPLALTLAPGMTDRDTRVEIRPLGA